MTVSQLIEELKKLPQDLVVVQDLELYGEDCGYSEVGALEVIKVENFCEGNYKDAGYSFNRYKPRKPTINAVRII
jgi:hypothetical protein